MTKREKKVPEDRHKKLQREYARLQGLVSAMCGILGVSDETLAKERENLADWIQQEREKRRKKKELEEKIAEKNIDESQVDDNDLPF